MNVEIGVGCTQRFDVTVTRDLVSALIILGAHHYDSACRGATMCGVGGFIYGWQNRFTCLEETKESVIEPINNRSLQTCLKLCEIMNLCKPLLTSKQLVTLSRFIRLGNTALVQASADERFAKVIQVELKP
jgi:hypothetical protein